MRKEKLKNDEIRKQKTSSPTNQSIKRICQAVKTPESGHNQAQFIEKQSDRTPSSPLDKFKNSDGNKQINAYNLDTVNFENSLLY